MATQYQRSNDQIAVETSVLSPLRRMRLSGPVQSTANVSRGTLKSLLSRHQGLVSVLQYLTRAGVMFMPSTMELYEVAVEGCYSTSQLITFLNSTILEESWERSSGLEDCMVIVTRAISHIEVLAEKLALALGGEYRRSQMAWLIELFKAVCRLVMLADRRKPTLLLHWGLFADPDEYKFDLSHYVRWYTRPVPRPPNSTRRYSAPLEEKEEPLELLPLAPSQAIQTHTLLKHTRSFQGKRSGLVLSVPGVPYTGARTSAACADATGASAAPVSISASNWPCIEIAPVPATAGHVEGIGAEDAAKSCVDADGGLARSGSGGYIECLTTYIGLPSQAGDGNAEEKERASTTEVTASASPDRGAEHRAAARPAVPAVVPVAQVPEPTPSGSQVSVAFPKIDAKYLIYLGEVLYTLRPAIYAWALHRVNRMHSTADVSAPATASSNGDTLGGAYAESDPNDHSRWVPSGNRPPRSRQQQGSTWGRLSRRLRANLWPSSLISTVSRLRSGYATTPAPTGGGYGREIDIALATAVAMMVEVASVQLTRMGLKLAREEAARCGAPPGEGDSETTNLHAFDKELQRRQLALLYYFLRSPLFDRTTLPLLEMAARLVARIPLLGGLPASAIGLVRYLNRTHFYTSASS